MIQRIKELLQGRFMKHPLHPLLVHLPVGLWVTALVSDIVFMANGSSAFAILSYYTILFGLIGAALAIPAGFAEYASIPRKTHPKRIATAHMLMNAAITVLFLANFLWRRNLEEGLPSVITRGQFFLTLFSDVLLTISGYLGGLLVYDHGIGFKPHLRGHGPLARSEDDLRRPRRAA